MQNILRTAVVVALATLNIVSTAMAGGADGTPGVTKARFGSLRREDMVVVDVSGASGGVDTNAVRDIVAEYAAAHSGVDTNAVNDLIGEYDRTTIAPRELTADAVNDLIGVYDRTTIAPRELTAGGVEDVVRDVVGRMSPEDIGAMSALRDEVVARSAVESGFTGWAVSFDDPPEGTEAHVPRDAVVGQVMASGLPTPHWSLFLPDDAGRTNALVPPVYAPDDVTNLQWAASAVPWGAAVSASRVRVPTVRELDGKASVSELQRVEGRVDGVAGSVSVLSGRVSAAEASKADRVKAEYEMVPPLMDDSDAWEVGVPGKADTDMATLVLAERDASTGIVSWRGVCSNNTSWVVDSGDVPAVVSYEVVEMDYGSSREVVDVKVTSGDGYGCSWPAAFAGIGTVNVDVSSGGLSAGYADGADPAKSEIVLSYEPGGGAPATNVVVMQRGHRRRAESEVVYGADLERRLASLAPAGEYESAELASSRWETVSAYIPWLEDYATNNYRAARLANRRVRDVEAWVYTNSVTREDMEAGMTAWAVTPFWPLGRVVPGKVDGSAGLWSLFRPDSPGRSAADALVPDFVRAGDDATGIVWRAVSWQTAAKWTNDLDSAGIAWTPVGDGTNVTAVFDVRATRVRVPSMADLAAMDEAASSRWETVAAYIPWLEDYATNNYRAARLANRRARDLEAWQYTNALTRADIERGMTDWAVTPFWPLGRVVVGQVTGGDDAGKWSLFGEDAPQFTAEYALAAPVAGSPDASGYVTSLAWPGVQISVSAVWTNELTAAGIAWTEQPEGTNVVAVFDAEASRVRVPTADVTLTGADIPVDATEGAQKIDAVLINKLDKSGGTMTGDVNLGEGGYTISPDVGGCIYTPTRQQILFPSSGGAFALLSQIGIPVFDSAAAYAVGAKVVYNDAVWNCETAVSRPGIWDRGNWDKLFDLVTGAPMSGEKKLITNGQVYKAIKEVDEHTWVNSYGLPDNCFPLKYTGPYHSPVSHTIADNRGLKFERVGELVVVFDAVDSDMREPICNFHAASLKYEGAGSPDTVSLIFNRDGVDIAPIEGQWPVLEPKTSVVVRNVGVATASDLSDALKGKLDSTSAAPAWVSGTRYTANALVTYNGVVYCNMNGGTFVSDIRPSADTNWRAMPVSDLFLGNRGWQHLAGHLVQTDIGPNEREKGIYFSSNPTDPMLWDIVFYGSDPDTHVSIPVPAGGYGTLAFAAVNPIAGNLAALDANGNPTNSTISAADVATKAEVAGKRDYLDLSYDTSETLTVPVIRASLNSGGQVLATYDLMCDEDTSSPLANHTYTWSSPDAAIYIQHTYGVFGSSWRLYSSSGNSQLATQSTSVTDGTYPNLTFELGNGATVTTVKTTGTRTLSHTDALALASGIPYAVEDCTLSNRVALLRDRTVNYFPRNVYAGGDITLSLPDAVDGRSRDFYVAVWRPSSVEYALVPPSGVSFIGPSGEDADFSLRSAKMTVLHFTELGRNNNGRLTFLVEGGNAVRNKFAQLGEPPGNSAEPVVAGDGWWGDEDKANRMSLVSDGIRLKDWAGTPAAFNSNNMSYRWNGLTLHPHYLEYWWSGAGSNSNAVATWREYTLTDTNGTQSVTSRDVESIPYYDLFRKMNVRNDLLHVDSLEDAERYDYVNLGVTSRAVERELRRQFVNGRQLFSDPRSIGLARRYDVTLCAADVPVATNDVTTVAKRLDDKADGVRLTGPFPDECYPVTYALGGTNYTLRSNSAVSLLLDDPGDSVLYVMDVERDVALCAVGRYDGVFHGPVYTNGVSGLRFDGASPTNDVWPVCVVDVRTNRVVYAEDGKLPLSTKLYAPGGERWVEADGSVMAVAPSTAEFTTTNVLGQEGAAYVYTNVSVGVWGVRGTPPQPNTQYLVWADQLGYWAFSSQPGTNMGAYSWHSKNGETYDSAEVGIYMGDTRICTFTRPSGTGVVDRVVFESALSGSSADPLFTAPRDLFAGWSFLEYSRAVGRYRWDAGASECYRISVSGGTVTANAVTNIDLTAIENAAALRAAEEAAEAASSQQ